MNQGRRGTTVWMGVIGVITGISALATLGEAPVLSLLLVAGYVGLLAFTYANDRVRQLQDMIPVLAASSKSTSAARAAVARARRLSAFATDEVVTDIGIIVNEKDRNNRWTRRLAQSVSLDDRAIQPFVKLNVPPQSSNRVALIKFEIVDKSGKVQFSRQVEQYVRDGENLIPCDQQLPLRDNDKLGRAGTWDLQISVNGTLAACHSFGVTPASTLSASRTRLADDGEVAVPTMAAPGTRARNDLSAAPNDEDEQDDMPLSLEELLREQRQESGRRS